MTFQDNGFGFALTTLFSMETSVRSLGATAFGEALSLT